MKEKKVDKKKLGIFEKNFIAAKRLIEYDNSLLKKKGKSATIDTFQHRFLYDILYTIKIFMEHNNKESFGLIYHYCREQEIRSTLEAIIKTLSYYKPKENNNETN